MNDVIFYTITHGVVLLLGLVVGWEWRSEVWRRRFDDDTARDMAQAEVNEQTEREREARSELNGGPR